MKKILILVFFVLSIIGCSSEETKNKKIKEETIVLKVDPDKYNNNFEYNNSLRTLILKMIYIFETNPNTVFNDLYFTENNSVFKISYYESNGGRAWGPSIRIEKIISSDKKIIILNLFLNNSRENPEIKLSHNENIVINRQNYKQYESQILFLFSEYVVYLEKQLNERDKSFEQTLKDLSSVSK